MVEARGRRGPLPTLEALAWAGLALAARAAVVLWAGARFPPVADGQFYDVFARRLAEGAGYTWQWPDGVVTPAAHYPVGYPAMLTPLYFVFGPRPWLAGCLNAVIGAVGVLAVFMVVLRASNLGRARVAAALVALSPALLLYTPALMTEGVAASLLTCALALATSDRGRWGRLVGASLLVGVATLVRPQVVVLAPVLGALVCSFGPPSPRTSSAPHASNAPRSLPWAPPSGWAAHALGAALATVIALACCAPWTARNCVVMKRCALVSVNGGWNLLIGTQTESGGWNELDVPEPCRTVWDEAGKDACFERAARAKIAADPADWLRRAPAKLRTTLDYFGAGPWYLHESNAAAFGERAKLGWGAVETVVSRGVLLAALLARAVRRDTRGRLALVLRALAAVAAVFALTDRAWVGYVLLSILVLASRPRAAATTFSAVLVLATAVVHAVFFGAGRYGLVVVPFVIILALVPPGAPDALPESRATA
jgi:hypothetical protein